MARALKLSEAIREGAKLKPQGSDTFFSVAGYDRKEGLYKHSTCALGAAFDFIEGEVDDSEVAVWSNDEIEDTLVFAFPLLKGVEDVKCPGRDCALFGGRHDSTLFNVITTLNDAHGWEREEIADWVEQFETVKA